MSSPVFWYATRATGLVAMVLLTMTTALGLVTASRMAGRTWTRFAVQDLHRSVSLLSVVFLVGHVVTSVVDTYVHIGWASVVVPFASSYKTFWVGLGAVSVDLMAAVVMTSLIRHRIPASTWRGVHWLAYASWPAAIAHGIGAGTDIGFRWAQGLTALCIVTVLFALAARLTDAYRSRRVTLGLPAVQARTAGVGIKRLAPSPPRPIPIASSSREGVGHARRH